MSKVDELQEQIAQLKEQHSKDVGAMMVIAGVFAMSDHAIAGTIFMVLGFLEMFFSSPKKESKK